MIKIFLICIFLTADAQTYANFSKTSFFYETIHEEQLFADGEDNNKKSL